MTLAIVPHDGDDNIPNWQVFAARAALAMVTDWAALLRGLILLAALVGVAICVMPLLS